MDNHNLTELQQAEQTARQALDRCYEGTAERGGYDVYAYCEARDAYREAVERRVRAEVERERDATKAKLPRPRKFATVYVRCDGCQYEHKVRRAVGRKTSFKCGCGTVLTFIPLKNGLGVVCIGTIGIPSQAHGRRGGGDPALFWMRQRLANGLRRITARVAP